MYQDKIITAKSRITYAIKGIRARLDSLEASMAQGRTVNDLGELQGLGPQLDAAVAQYALLQELEQDAAAGAQDAARVLGTAGGGSGGVSNES